MKLKKRRKLMASTQGRLPSGYTELDYIESTGTQYIRTQIPYNLSNSYKCIVENWRVTANRESVFGYDGGGIHSLYRFIYVDTELNEERMLWSPTASVSYRYEGIPVGGYVSGEIECKPNGATYNGTSLIEVQDSTASGMGNMTVFRARGSYYGRLRLKSLIVTNNDILLGDFIPCKNPQNEVGLYDLIRQTFYGNSGTGTFIAGSPV